MCKNPEEARQSPLPTPMSAFHFQIFAEECVNIKKIVILAGW